MHARRVSILTRPWGRVQHLDKQPCVCGIMFQSSPARGGGCNAAAPAGARAAWFQSSPARGGGCNTDFLQEFFALRVLEFQSSPARGGGCNEHFATDGGCDAIAVSILTRPWGRVQRAARNARTRTRAPVSILTRPWGRVQLEEFRVVYQRIFCFNPHPPVGAGATLQAA